MSINIGDNANIGGSVTLAETIRDSFNIVNETDKASDLKETLTELINAVNQMSKDLSEDDANEVAKNLEILTREATSDKPSQKWWQLSSEGLKEAAGAVGSIGVPVIESLHKLLPMLTG